MSKCNFFSLTKQYIFDEKKGRAMGMRLGEGEMENQKVIEGSLASHEDKLK